MKPKTHNVVIRNVSNLFLKGGGRRRHLYHLYHLYHHISELESLALTLGTQPTTTGGQKCSKVAKVSTYCVEEALHKRQLQCMKLLQMKAVYLLH